MRVPLFPLNTVLMPGGLLALRIFETRYLDMIAACLRTESSFGVSQIREGREVGEPALAFEVGTLASVIDCTRDAGGLLHVEALGGEKFRTLSVEVMRDRLQVAEVEVLEPEPKLDLPVEYHYIAAMLGELLPKVSSAYAEREMATDDAAWVGGRITELLPLPGPVKQQLLEMHDPLARLAELHGHLQRLRMS